MFDPTCGTGWVTLEVNSSRIRKYLCMFLRFFQSAIFTSFIIMRGNRWLVNVPVAFQFHAQAPGTGLRAGWLLCNCPALAASYKYKKISNCIALCAICSMEFVLNTFPLHLNANWRHLFLFHRLLYIEVTGVCMCIMLQTEQYEQVHVGIDRAAKAQSAPKGLTFLPRQ